MCKNFEHMNPEYVDDVSLLASCLSLQTCCEESYDKVYIS